VVRDDTSVILEPCLIGDCDNSRGLRKNLKTKPQKEQALKNNNAIKASCLLTAMCLGITGVASAESKQPDSGGEPVKVFILSGQSNMVGAGKVTGGESRWGSEFLEPVVSV
jgi:hypothetical protein